MHTPPKNKLQKEKERLIENIEKIDNMETETTIEDFKAKVYMSTASQRTKHFLLKACTLRLAQIHNRYDLLAVNGDLDDFN